MKETLKSQKGVTMIVLVVIVIIMILIAGTIIYKSDNGNEIKKVNKLYNDIELLEQKVQEYYLANNKLPILGKYTSIEMLKNKNPNDAEDEYYLLDIGKLEGIRLNYGEGFEEAKVNDPSDYYDVYIINKQSHTVYYPKGVEMEGEWYYRSSEKYALVEKGTLPETSETKPYYPDDTFSSLVGTDLEKGLVISDGTSEYVWIEVPKSITISATTDDQIETALRNYAKDYLRDGYIDTWYDSNGNTEGVGIATDNTGCGLTLEQHKQTKSKILQGIKKYGGFWIGRYEMGIDGDAPRIGSSARITNDSPKAVSAQNKYVYNYILVSEAQKLAMNMATGNYNSSLMLGVQWGLVFKYIEIKAPKTKEDIKVDSTGWGNFKKSSFTIDRGRYTSFTGEKYYDVLELQNKVKETNVAWLLTTGAADRNKVLNIYDIVGNVNEWTLEHRGEYAILTGGDAEGHWTAGGGHVGGICTNVNGITIAGRNTLY